MSWDESVTTVMVRNLPRSCRQLAFMKELNNRGFKGTVNFLYLPFDFRSFTGVGYGFLNFKQAKHAEAFRDEFDGTLLDAFETTDLKKKKKDKHKPLRVHPASVQGYEANFAHFSQSKAGQKNDPEFSPLFLPANENGPLRVKDDKQTWQQGEQYSAGVATSNHWGRILEQTRQQQQQQQQQQEQFQCLYAPGQWHHEKFESIPSSNPCVACSSPFVLGHNCCAYCAAASQITPVSWVEVGGSPTCDKSLVDAVGGRSKSETGSTACEDSEFGDLSVPDTATPFGSPTIPDSLCSFSADDSDDDSDTCSLRRWGN